ncbi:hypothetical protein ACJX0J_030523, partial [Zea mays]
NIFGHAKALGKGLETEYKMKLPQILKQDENVIVNQNGVSVGGDHNGLEEEYFGSNFGRFEVAVLNTSIMPTQIDHVDDGSIEDLEEDDLLDVGWESKMTTTIFKFRKIWAMIETHAESQPAAIQTKNLENSKGNTFKNSSRASLKNQGLRDLAKSTFLYDTSLEYDLDFTFLMKLSMILILLETPQKKTMIGFLLREQEIYWIQRSKATNVLKGDDNTKQFSKWNIISR